MPNDLDILLTQSRGRPLYRLGITQAQYTALKDYLIHIQTKYQYSLSTLCRHRIYAKAFVLYASEWWRREYRGHWRWDDLLVSLKLDKNTFNSTERLTLSECGFRAWGRTLSISQKGRRSALGTFMKEGGLPISYFNANGGWLEKLLQSALNYASQDKNYKHYIQENGHIIPQSAGMEDIIDVLCELTTDIYHLIVNHHLDEHSNPILYLNDNAPNWSKQLPFPLEAQTAQTLLEKLITDSSVVRRKYKKSPKEKPEPTHWHEQLQLIRTIEFDKSYQKITLSARLNDFDHLPVFDEQSLMAMSDNISLDFYQNSDENTLIKQLFAYPVINQKRLKIIKPIAIDLNDWCGGLTLQITDHTGGILPIKDHQDNPINPYQNASMTAIDKNTPFLMAIDEENDQKFIARYISNGSRTTKQEMALLYVPAGYQYNLATNSILIKVSPMLSGDLYYLVGEVELKNNIENSYRFKTNSQDANYHYEIKGRRLTDFIYPYLVYKKDFNIYKTNIENADDCQKISHHKIKLKAVNSNIYKSLTQYQELFGVYELLVLSDKNEVVFQTSLGIVPNDFRYDFTPNPHNGKIIFQNHSIHSISLDNNPYGIDIENKNQDEFLLSTKELPHQKITLSLHTNANQNYPCLKLRCHFPSSQTFIYDNNGNKINKTLFGINNALMGYRIKIFNARQHRPNEKIEFYLKSKPNIKLYLPMALKADEFVSLEPYRWEKIIKSLITLSKKGLDDIVVVKFNNNSNQGFELNFSYYEFRIHKEQNKLVIKCHQELSERHNFDNVALDSLRKNHQLIAFNFNSPEYDKTLSINDDFYHDLTCLNELSESDEQYAGVWFIKSHDISEYDTGEAIAIRPIAHTPPTQITPESSALEHRQVMKQKLRDELNKMSFDINDGGWAYLKTLSEKIPHLPLIALEQWQIVKTIPKLLAQIAIFGDDLFDKNIYQKYQEGFQDYWQFLNIGEFKRCWENYPVYLSNTYQEKIPDADILNTVIQEVIKNKKASLSEYDVFALFFEHIDNKFSINIQIAEKMLNDSFDVYVIKRQNNQTQFIQNQTLNEIIDKTMQKIPSDIIITPGLLERHPDTKTVALLPMVMAYLSAQITLDEDLLSLQNQLIENALAIYQIKAFDKQWFNDCFDIGFGWFYHCNTH